jgi:biotin carboxyl carrier protein
MCLLILEAMKMENALKATADGEVKKIAVKEGQAVEKGQLLIDLT